MKLIIFDIDGTLCNTKEVDDRCFIKAFEQTFSTDIGTPKWEDIQCFTDWGIAEELTKMVFNRSITQVEFTLLKYNFLKILKDENIRNFNDFLEIPGASSFFNKMIKSDKYVVGIATGAWKESAELKLKNIGINPLNVAFSNSSCYRTREEIVLHTIRQAKEKHNLEFKEIIYFGDGEWDFKTCKNLNVRFIGIDINSKGHLARLGAKEIYTDFTDVGLNRIF